MKVIGSVLLLAGISAAQMCSPLASRRAFEAAASAPAAEVIWSEPVGLLKSGETHALFLAFSVADPTHLGQELRGVRVDLTSPDYNGVVYVEGPEIAVLRRRADWLARMAKTYPDETAAFGGGENSDPPCSFVFTYRRTGGNNTSLYLRTEFSQPGAGRLQQIQFTGVPPSELVAIFDRAAKALKR